MQVRDALATKVSKERIGTELHGIFTGPDPVGAVKNIQRLGLFPVIFSAPSKQADSLGPSVGGPCCQVMAAAADVLQAWETAEPWEVEEKRLTLLAALLLPLSACTVQTAKGKEAPLTGHIILESIKWKRKDAEGVAALHAAAPGLLQVHQSLQGIRSPDDDDDDAAAASGSTSDKLRIKYGRLLRGLGKLGLARAGMVLASVLSMPEAAPMGVDAALSQDAAHLADSLTAAKGSAPEQTTLARVEMCQCLADAMEAFRLRECWKLKPLLTGQEVMGMLGIKGKQVGEVMERLTDWQLAHPGATAEACREWLMSSQSSR